jgi:hypothetical protein
MKRHNVASALSDTGAKIAWHEVSTMIDKRRTRREAPHRALGAGNSLKAGIAELVHRA